MDREANGKSWMLEVDMRRKTLISVVSCDRHAHPMQWDVSIAAKHLPPKLHSSLLNV
jgi:hypothetical protein